MEDKNTTMETKQRNTQHTDVFGIRQLQKDDIFCYYYSPKASFGFTVGSLCRFLQVC